MSYISIYGFNKKLKKQKIYNILNSAVFGKKLQCQFCLHEIHPDADPRLSVVLITLGNKQVTQKALNLINGFVYFDNQTKTELHLSAIDTTEHLRVNACNNDDQSTRDKEVRQRGRSHGPHESRNRSRSPNLDINKIDMEIELIQKERILIVEQRKLLLERKRLELLKEFEPTSITDLERFAAAIIKQDDHEQKPVPHKPARVRGTPVPVLASRAIVKQMKEAMAKRNNTNDITQPLYFTLRKRIIEIIKGKSNLETEDIIQMYRENYPIESDEGLLDCIEEQINTIKSVVNTEKEVSHEEKVESGPSNIDKVNNEESKRESEKKEATIEFLDNELDDWLEDDKVNQDGIDIGDTKQSAEVDDKELKTEEVVDLKKNEL